MTKHHETDIEMLKCLECIQGVVRLSNEDQRRIIAIAKILEDFDKLPHTVHAPDFKDEGEAGCLSVAVVRSFLRDRLKEL